MPQKAKMPRDFSSQETLGGAEVSLRNPTLLSRKTIRDAKSAQEQKGKKKSACSIRNDGGDTTSA